MTFNDDDMVCYRPGCNGTDFVNDDLPPFLKQQYERAGIFVIICLRCGMEQNHEKPVPERPPARMKRWECWKCEQLLAKVPDQPGSEQVEIKCHVCNAMNKQGSVALLEYA